MNDERRTLNGPPESVTTVTYAKVIVVEAAIIILLYIFGRIFS